MKPKIKPNDLKKFFFNDITNFFTTNRSKINILFQYPYVTALIEYYLQNITNDYHYNNDDELYNIFNEQNITNDNDNNDVFNNFNELFNQNMNNFSLSFNEINNLNEINDINEIIKKFVDQIKKIDHEYEVFIQNHTHYYANINQLIDDFEKEQDETEKIRKENIIINEQNKGTNYKNIFSKIFNDFHGYLNKLINEKKIIRILLGYYYFKNYTNDINSVFMYIIRITQLHFIKLETTYFNNLIFKGQSGNQIEQEFFKKYVFGAFSNFMNQKNWFKKKYIMSDIFEVNTLTIQPKFLKTQKLKNSIDVEIYQYKKYFNFDDENHLTINKNTISLGGKKQKTKKQKTKKQKTKKQKTKNKKTKNKKQKTEQKTKKGYFILKNIRFHFQKFLD
jgi:hypothetical protein